MTDSGPPTSYACREEAVSSTGATQLLPDGPPVSEPRNSDRGSVAIYLCPCVTRRLTCPSALPTVLSQATCPLIVTVPARWDTVNQPAFIGEARTAHLELPR